MRKYIRNVLRVWLGILVMPGLPAAAGALEIAVFEPSAYDGDTIIHDSQTLRVQGEVSGDAEVMEVTINGRPATMATRDLVVEGLEEEGTPFRGVLTLSGGDNAIEIRATDANGATATLRFTVEVESLSGEAYALIVGVNDYQDGRVSDLRFAEPDARSMKEALTHPQYGIVKPANLVMLTGAQATYRNISTALEEHLVRKATRAQDVVLFYFAGHGAEGPHVSRGAAYYLVPQDAELTNLLSTAIDKGRLQFLWGAIGARRKVFITDACHSGGLQNMKVLSADGFETVEGHVTMAAARADQLALELPRLGHGLFTYSLTEGMKGGADQDGDGFVSAAELGRYIKARVQQMAAEMGADQEPVVELVPGAAATPVATSEGKPLPAWSPSAPPQAESFIGMIRVTLRFEERKRQPYVLVAIRDEEGDRHIEQVAATAVMDRFMAAGDAFRFIEPGAVEGALEGGKAQLAFSDDPGDIAAVARAVSADLMLTGRFKTESSGLEDEDMKELLGTTLQSFQAHLNARVVYANTGEIIQAVNVQTAGAHLNPTMARRRALEKACEQLADELMAPLVERWAELRRERPGGMLTAENVDDYQTLGKLEEALAGLAPAVRDVRWQSFEGGEALFEFAPGGSAEEAASRLRQQGLPGFKVGGLQASKGKLSFWLK